MSIEFTPDEGNEEMEFTPDQSETTGFDDLMREAFPQGIEPQPDERVNVGVRQQGAFWATEALLQLGTAWHIEDELYAALGPKYQWFDQFQGTLSGAVRRIVQDHGPMAGLDFMHGLEQFAADAADVISGYMMVHGMSSHVHAWVYLTNIGFTPVSIGPGPGGHAYMVMPLPRDRDPIVIGNPPAEEG